MDQSNQAELVDHELVGRRLRDQPDHYAIDDGSGGVTVLVGAFFENRVDANISVDRFWSTTPAKNAKDKLVAEMATVCEREGWGNPMGWACATVGEYKKTKGIRGALATGHAANERHADLLKAEFLIIKETDDSRTKREKASLLAQELADRVNMLLKRNQAQILNLPD